MASPAGVSSRRSGAPAGGTASTKWGVVVEVDGRLGRASWTDVQRDGRRDRSALVAGRITLRCYWTDLVPTGCALAGEVGQVLRARGWTGAPRPCGPGCPVGSTSRAWDIAPR